MKAILAFTGRSMKAPFMRPGWEKPQVRRSFDLPAMPRLPIASGRCSPSSFPTKANVGNATPPLPLRWFGRPQSQARAPPGRLFADVVLHAAQQNVDPPDWPVEHALGEP